jgi:hypothetical protein
LQLKSFRGEKSGATLRAQEKQISYGSHGYGEKSTGK